MIRLARKDAPCHGIKVPSMVQPSELSTLGVSNMNSNVFGIDIAKQVFQIHWVDQETSEVHSGKVKRKDFVQYFANQQPSMIGMEACGGAHHWGRLFKEMAHCKEKNGWLESLQTRRPKNVVIVALANKIARTVWALVANQTEYQPC